MIKKILLFSFTFLLFNLQAQIKLVSWNIENFGKSKSNENIKFTAKTLRDYDVIAIQEVVAGLGGAQAVAILADELNRLGAKWDYIVSDPTTGTAHKKERYAYIWKTAKLVKVDAWLEKMYSSNIEREPFLISFKKGRKEFTIASIHAITKSESPEKELCYLKEIAVEYKNKSIIFCGDFNTPQSHAVFIDLRKSRGFSSALVNQKTSLKRECVNENCLASEFDNFYFDSKKYKLIRSDVIHFYKSFENLKLAREISDHIPVFMEFEIQ